MNQDILLSINVQVLVLGLHAIKDDGLDNLVIVPIDTGQFLGLISSLARFTLHLFLFGRMVLKDLLAFGENNVLTSLHLL